MNVVVVGIGNPDRGDDAAGRLVARRLASRVRSLEQGGEATALVEALGSADVAFVVDASASGAPVGSIARFDVSAAPLPARVSALSSHGLGLADALELARVLGTLPGRCIVYSIEGQRFVAGAPPSPAVVAAVDAVAERIAAEIGEGARPCTSPR